MNFFDPLGMDFDWHCVIPFSLAAKFFLITQTIGELKNVLLTYRRKMNAFLSQDLQHESRYTHEHDETEERNVFCIRM